MRTRAALFREPGRPLEVRPIELREPRPGEVLVRMAAVGICGTDLHVVKGEWQRPTPMVLGHEGAGVVEALGEGVEGLAVDDRVVLSWAPGCGECADCRRGRPAACITLQRAIGAARSRTAPPGWRWTARRSTAARRRGPQRATGGGRDVALPVGDDIPLEEAARWGAPPSPGSARCFAARPAAGATVLVVGAGGVGQFVVQGARIAGARTIVAADPIEGRRQQAERLGATHVSAPDDLRALMSDVAPDGVDYAFDAVGDPATSVLALRWMNGGTTVLAGLPAAGERLDLDPTDFTRREKLLTGTMYGSRIPRLPCRSFSTTCVQPAAPARPRRPRFGLDEVNGAVEASLAGSPGRVLVLP